MPHAAVGRPSQQKRRAKSTSVRFGLKRNIDVSGAQLRLRPRRGWNRKIGKTTFRIGEPIRLDLVISNSTGTPMMVNTTDYGDNSDPVEITPQTGWIAWQGRSGHDYAQMTQLGRGPTRIPIRVDQVAIFCKPGHYEVRVTENRVQNGSDLLHLSPSQILTTNPVGIDLEAMPDGAKRR